ncbi:McrB family protein [Nocardia brasiliensis]|uniref:McrB family protein n=1 Tax=Nocardia brasiliensis TaxID=37326 RepID=UPI0024563125|nr:AAA family ATPase [Nocardia brasiliensis]
MGQNRRVAEEQLSLGRSGSVRVEAVARTIMRRCLVDDDSLFTPGRAIWTPEHLAELHRAYVDAPDASGASFVAKLEHQLAEVAPPARQLFAEIYTLNVLPLVNLLPTTKIRAVERILEPLEEAVGIPGDVLAAFQDGVFNGGRAFNSRRWAQLAYLVEFAEYFKSHDPAQRQAARADPFACRAIVRGAPGPREPAQRQALLYLFHPEYFLPIVSGAHRTALRDGLAQAYLPSGATDDLDRDLRAIDDAVRAATGAPVDYYLSPWREMWQSDNTGGSVVAAEVVAENDDDAVEATPYTVAEIIADGCFHSAEALRQMLARWSSKKNLVLQGAPGTGKTWLARRLAYALIGSQSPEAIRSVQFHPNTCYEDFVRGWRPVSTADGSGRLDLVDGPLIAHAERARRQPDIPHVLVIEEINRGNPAQAFGEMLTLIEATKRSEHDALELSYSPVPGERYHLPDNLYLIGTMNIADRSLALVDFALRRRFAFETLAPAFTEAWAAELRSKLPMSGDLVARIHDRVAALNTTIAEHRMLGPSFQIGHSFFTPNEAQSDGWRWFLGVVESEIEPLLREYWFDEPATADDAVARLKA